MQTSSFVKDTSVIIACVAKHSSPYASMYVNGVLNASYTSGDFVNPLFGQYFYIGLNSFDVNRQMNGNIRRWAKWNRALSATEISEITALWQANP